MHYLNWLSEEENLEPAYFYNTEQWKLNTSASGYRLPTEAEWEYAAIGGHEYEYSSPIGFFPANGYGLYDMSGNIHEWVNDWYVAEYYQYCVDNNITENPLGPETGQEKVKRGGSWADCHCGARITSRRTSNPDAAYNYVGFRIARNSK